MKHLHIAFLAILSGFLCSCLSIYPEPTKPDPQPIPVQNGAYVVRELGNDRKAVREWQVKTYRYSFHPKYVEFVDAEGKTIRLTRSFEILKKVPAANQ